jgi:hypothetical protein
MSSPCSAGMTIFVFFAVCEQGTIVMTISRHVGQLGLVLSHWSAQGSHMGWQHGKKKFCVGCKQATHSIFLQF